MGQLSNKIKTGRVDSNNVPCETRNTEKGLTKMTNHIIHDFEQTGNNRTHVQGNGYVFKSVVALGGFTLAYALLSQMLVALMIALISGAFVAIPIAIILLKERVKLMEAQTAKTISETKLIEAQTLSEERSVIQSPNGVYVRDEDLSKWSNLSLAQTVRVSNYRSATPRERATWDKVNSKSGKDAPIDTSGDDIGDDEPNLRDILKQPLQCYGIIGPQQSGKTYQIRHIANDWLNKGIKPVVIAPKVDVGEWEGCQVFGKNYNYAEVRQGLQAVKDEAERRHKSGKPHKSHGLLPVIIDDWTVVNVHSKEITEDFVINATTIYAGVNIVLYFILHSDTATSWGVAGVGASLKDGMPKLFVLPSRTGKGTVDRTKTLGFIKYPESAQQPIELIRGIVDDYAGDELPNLVTALPIGDESNETKPREITAYEQKLIDAYDKMKENGERLSYRGILRQANGKGSTTGGKQIKEVKELLRVVRDFSG